MLRALLPLAIALVAAPVLAVAPEEDSPPAPTPTTTVCQAGLIWDEDTRTCVTIEQSRLDEDTLRRTARELAYADRSADALDLLERSAAPARPDVLTLTAFAHGRAGDFDTALPIYAAALTADPDNLLARAYMGLALIAAGRWGTLSRNWARSARAAALAVGRTGRFCAGSRPTRRLGTDV